MTPCVACHMAMLFEMNNSMTQALPITIPKLLYQRITALGTSWITVAILQVVGRVEQHNVFKVKSDPSHVCRGIIAPEDCS